MFCYKKRNVDFYDLVRFFKSIHIWNADFYDFIRLGKIFFSDRTDSIYHRANLNDHKNLRSTILNGTQIFMIFKIG